MLLTFTVELKTSPTFTGRKKVDNEFSACAAIKRMETVNRKKGYRVYSGFKLYELDIENKKLGKLIKQWP